MEFADVPRHVPTMLITNVFRADAPMLRPYVLPRDFARMLNCGQSFWFRIAHHASHDMR